MSFTATLDAVQCALRQPDDMRFGGLFNKPQKNVFGYAGNENSRENHEWPSFHAVIVDMSGSGGNVGGEY